MTTYRYRDFPPDLVEHVLKLRRETRQSRVEIAMDVRRRWKETFPEFGVHHVDRITLGGGSLSPRPAGRPAADPRTHYSNCVRKPVPITLGGPAWSRPLRHQT